MSEEIKGNSFETLVQEALDAPFEGWNFSYLQGRMSEEPLPWSYHAAVRERLCDTASLLDMGTGGGEFLSTLVPLPRHTRATEAYAPNVAVARRRLEPLSVRAVKPEARCTAT